MVQVLVLRHLNENALYIKGRDRDFSRWCSIDSLQLRIKVHFYTYKPLFQVMFFFLSMCQGISTQSSLHTNVDECYAYQDEIGTPYCVTILDTTLQNGIVMFRSRNTTLQEFMHVSDILSTVRKHLGLKAFM